MIVAAVGIKATKGTNAERWETHANQYAKKQQANSGKCEFYCAAFTIFDFSYEIFQAINHIVTSSYT